MQAYQIRLTNGRPNQERYWDVPDLTGCRGEFDAGSGGYSRVKIVRTLEYGQLVYNMKGARARPLRVFSIFHA